MESLLKFIAVILLCVVSPVVSRPSYEIAARQTTDRLVFCHFMVGLLKSESEVPPTLTCSRLRKVTDRHRI